MNILEKILSRKPAVILDGALATELEARGFDIDDDLWSANALMKAPELIKAIHRDYLRAGADIVTNASYQATVEGFMRRGLSHFESVKLIKLSVELAKEVCTEFENKFVAASIGPYGAFLADGSEYRGNYIISHEQLKIFHRERLAILASAQPDIFACETIPCLIEAKAIVEELAAYPEFCAWVSFSCKDVKHISNGELISDCAAWLDKQSQVVAVGINCTAPNYIESLISEIRSATSKRIIVYPNSGEAYDVKARAWIGERINFAENSRLWYRAGARIIGGCCRTTPKDIENIEKSFH